MEELLRRPAVPQISTSTVTTAGSLPYSDTPQPRLLRFYFSGRDLPEPDSRSRISYAVIYHAQEGVASPSHSGYDLSLGTPDLKRRPASSIPRFSSMAKPSTPSITPPSTPPRQRSVPTPAVPMDLSDAARRKLATTFTPSELPAVPARQKSSRPLGLNPPRRNIQKTSVLRAPQHCEKVTAPSQPEVYETEDGTRIIRTAWTKIGSTDLARKHGRDVEFARSFTFDYVPGTNQVIRVAFFDSTSHKADKQRLIGTAQFRVSHVYAARGKPVLFPLKFMPVSEKDVKRSSKIRDGALVVVGEFITEAPVKYRLDVECNKIMRAKSLTTAAVKKIFYTIHAIIDSDPDSDQWTLIYRSEPVAMIHRKRDGGSLEYNYFTSRRLIAAPGMIIDGSKAKTVQPVNSGRKGYTGEGKGEEGVFEKVGKMLGRKQKEQFFSLPGADLQISSDSMRLKMSLFEDNGTLGGFDLVADTELSFADIKTLQLGESFPIKVHSNTVGRAVLKYVECSQNPKYFCMSMRMQGSL